jgi:hypothetical protein
VDNDLEEFGELNAHYFLNSTFHDELVGVAYMVARDDKIMIKNFVELDPLFFKFLEWKDYFPEIHDKPTFKFLKYTMPQILMQFFRTLFWNIRSKQQDINNAMTSISEGKNNTKSQFHINPIQ